MNFWLELSNLMSCISIKGWVKGTEVDLNKPFASKKKSQHMLALSVFSFKEKDSLHFCCCGHGAYAHVAHTQVFAITKLEIRHVKSLFAHCA